ncbi:glycosyltransferase family 4 protein [Funiculus sociatus GB2-A5]|uniref:Glycosyltransferase family 4 protein n=1 Tax=Funiculus sociatus GB2-A5 TaxID=2933946 RepID=A0ABV0JVR7_9CYAN|nr:MULTISPECIES: glycosyltransferase family 4 protein [unclassified Trichocoleus]
MNDQISANILCVGLGWFPETPGGLDRYVYELTHQLAAGQDRVELCGVGLPETQTNSPIKITNLSEPDNRLWERLWLIRSNFLRRKSSQPDAINLHFALYSLPLLQVLPPGVPITFSFHGPWALESEQEGAGKLSVFLKHWVEQRVYNRCDRFIVLSKAFGTILHQEYQVPWSKIHIIPGGVDLSRFQCNLSRQEARAQLDWPQDRPILFTPRRLVHRVGLDKLLTAIATIKPKIPDVWLAIAGKGSLKPDLEQQATELGLNEHARLLGFLPDKQLPIAYQAADLSVMPSQSLEGFGLAVLESLACGTPVLCTPVGGMPEILEPFSPDLIASSIETTAIAERLEELLIGKVPMPSREACQEYAATHFDWQKIAQKVRQVLLA